METIFDYVREQLITEDATWKFQLAAAKSDVAGQLRKCQEQPNPEACRKAVKAQFKNRALQIRKSMINKKMKLKN